MNKLVTGFNTAQIFDLIIIETYIKGGTLISGAITRKGKSMYYTSSEKIIFKSEIIIPSKLLRIRTEINISWYSLNL